MAGSSSIPRREEFGKIQVLLKRRLSFGKDEIKITFELSHSLYVDSEDYLSYS